MSPENAEEYERCLRWQWAFEREYFQDAVRCPVPGLTRIRD